MFGDVYTSFNFLIRCWVPVKKSDRLQSATTNSRNELSHNRSRDQKCYGNKKGNCVLQPHAQCHLLQHIEGKECHRTLIGIGVWAELRNNMQIVSSTKLQNYILASYISFSASIRQAKLLSKVTKYCDWVYETISVIQLWVKTSSLEQCPSPIIICH